MKSSLLCAFGAALALTLSGAASAQMHPTGHHDDGPAMHGPMHPAPAVHKDRYGSWNNSWGARPGAAPSFWTKKGDWYRHVRACQRKYRGYSWKTDTYWFGKKKLRCRL